MAEVTDIRGTSDPADSWPAKAVLVHLGTLTVVTAWAFGGQSPGARTWLLAWLTLGIGLFFALLGRLEATHARVRRTALGHLWPLLVFDAIAALGTLHPVFEPIVRDGTSYLRLVALPSTWLPVCARPEATLVQLWLINGIIVSAYNGFLALRSRRRIRQLLLVGAANVVALAVFGTFQKLLAAPGLYFGLVPSPQAFFFSTFVYHNHWSAFVLLQLAACLGLFFHALRRQRHRDIWHSPVLAGAVAVLLLAATLPLSGSRSGTALGCVLLGAAVVHLLRGLLASRREHHESTMLPVAGIALAVVCAAVAIVALSRDVVVRRAELTARQVAQLRSEDRPDARLTLYRDTWRMAADRPWFGWGLESYGDIFRIYNTQRTVEAQLGQPYYKNAHNDWLQTLAECGAVGTVLLVLTGLLPLVRVRWREVGSRLPRYLVAGCALILLYACLEFPLANPSVLIAFWGQLFLAARYAMLDLADRAGEAAN